jgi:hypothetical protein
VGRETKVKRGRGLKRIYVRSGLYGEKEMLKLFVFTVTAEYNW